MPELAKWRIGEIHQLASAELKAPVVRLFRYAGPADFRLLRHAPGAAIDARSGFCTVRRYRVDGIRHLAAPRRHKTLEVQRLAGRTATAVRASAWPLVRRQGRPADGRTVIRQP